MERIIILGASGQAGRWIFQDLLKCKDFIVEGTSRSGGNNLLKFDPFIDDLSVLGKADVLINCIGIINEISGFTFEKIHKGTTELILKNRAALGFPVIIQISALGASPGHHVSFLRTKGQADESLLTESDTYVIRPSVLCTPGTMLVQKIRMMGKISRMLSGVLPVPAGFADHKVQPVMPDDLSSLIEKIVRKRPVCKIIDTGGSRVFSYRELVEIYSQQQNLKIRIAEFPEKLIRYVVKNIIAPLFSRIINNEQYDLLFTDNVADTVIAEEILGRQLQSSENFWRKELSN
jgi:uncharacterized protein YbjT (DUF2867 family)